MLNVKLDLGLHVNVKLKLALTFNVKLGLGHNVQRLIGDGP